MPRAPRLAGASWRMHSGRPCDGIHPCKAAPRHMLSFQFDNAFLRELPGDPSDDMHRPRRVDGAWSRVLPTPVAKPRVLAWSPEMARRLDLTGEDVASPSFAEVFGGN